VRHLVVILSLTLPEILLVIAGETWYGRLSYMRYVTEERNLRSNYVRAVLKAEAFCAAKPEKHRRTRT